MDREQLKIQIKSMEEKIAQYQQNLQTLRERLDQLIDQEKERQYYISSREILDLIYKSTGKKSNMSTIKRWADEGYLGEVVDEQDKFWALRTLQGKKRFLYPKKNVFDFLYNKGLIKPKFEVLDRVHLIDESNKSEPGVIVDSFLKEDTFYYTIQMEKSREVIQNIKEANLKREG